MEKDSLLTLIRVNGFCVIDQIIPRAECARIETSVAQTAMRLGGEYDVPGGGIGFVPGVINHDQSFAPYLANELLLALVNDLLGDHVRISFTSAIVNMPGNARGGWHSDWPFNQNNAGHIPAPYPDAVVHLTTLWMLSGFTPENGGTLVVPGSHRTNTNPTAVAAGIDPNEPFPTEMSVTGIAGSVLVMDSRLWHATSPNRSNEARTALAVRYAPWWLNLEVLRPESEERQRMVVEAGRSDNQVPSLPREVFRKLPVEVRPLYRHWVVD